MLESGCGRAPVVATISGGAVPIGVRRDGPDRNRIESGLPGPFPIHRSETPAAPTFKPLVQAVQHPDG